MQTKARINGFRFLGFDAKDEPIIRRLTGKDDEPLETKPENPAPGELVTTITIYHENPTWVCVNGRCWRV